MELNLPVMVTLSFRDKVDYDVSKLKDVLQLPVIAVNSHDRSDISKLKQFIIEAIDEEKPQHIDKVNLGELNPLIDSMIDRLNLPISLNPNSRLQGLPRRWMVVQSLLSGTESIQSIPAMITTQIDAMLKQNNSIDLFKVKMTLIKRYYNTAQEITNQVLMDEPKSYQSKLHKLDTILLHPVGGILVFVISMTFMFVTTFYVTEPINILLETGLELLSSLITATVASELLTSLLVDGIIGGIGFVLIFIPQIAVLFIFLGVMEQTGYMSRVIYVTDQWLAKLKISGTSIAPLLLGFGCNVPGIMATRAIQDENERITVGLVNPFLSCTARLPVFIIISAALFPNYAGLVVSSLYFLGIIIAIAFMYLYRHTILKGNSRYLLMEVPELSIPNYRVVMLGVIRHVKSFLKNAASWMSVGILLIWILSITGPSGYLGPDGLTTHMDKNWISAIGLVLAPVFGPMHWDHRLIIALVLGFIAKEIVIGSLGVLYGLSSGSLLQPVLIQEFSPITAYAFMVFVLLYTPCIGTYMTMRQEFGKKWANFSVVISLIVAYLASLLVIIISNLIW